MRVLCQLAAAIQMASGRDLSAFQPYSAFGNTIHIGTADFDGVGVKDYVVTFNVDSTVTAFKRLEDVGDPHADNRLWSLSAGVFSFMITTARSDRTKGSGDRVFLPGADGNLRRISPAGALEFDIKLGKGPLYCVDAGYTRDGSARLVAGGVDGDVHFLSWDGQSVGSVRPVHQSLIRRVVVGDFDGDGGDEVAVFYNTGGFRGGAYLTFYDLETMDAPSYWSSGAKVEDDVYSLGWTDKQLPFAYDMDGDGDEELVAHWGVLHPERGPGTKVLSTMMASGERLDHDDDYDAVHPFTNTNEYLMQRGVPGRFKADNKTGMLTVFGDDLHFFTYDMSKAEDEDRFRCTDYGYSHTLYHFTDGARLESRHGPDRIVLSGPNNGDDRFYVVDLARDEWKAHAKKIDYGGKLKAIENSLDKVISGIDSFDGVVAEGGPVSWTQVMTNYSCFAGGLSVHDDAEQELRASCAAQVMGELYESFGLGQKPKKVTIYAEMSIEKVKDTDQMVRWLGALARHGVHFSLKCGHGNHVWLTPDQLKQVYRASVVDGVSYMMLQTKEIQEGSYFGLYAGLMETLRSETGSLGLSEPSKIFLAAKGALLTGLTAAEWANLTSYKDVVIMGSEDSNVRVNEWSFSERHSLWLAGEFETLSATQIGDFVSTNRAAEWSDVRNGHMVFRMMLSAFSLGATMFRADNTLPFHNPLFDRGDTDDPSLALSSAYRQGVAPFFRMVEAGVLPSAPKPWQVKGVSPVSVSLPAPDARFLDQSVFHDFNKFEPQGKIYAANYLECWNAYKNVPDVDITAIIAGTTRRWDSLFPTSPSGFVPLLPFHTREVAESKPWCNRSFETDVNYWAEFDSDYHGLNKARKTIGAELVSQRANTLMYVEPADADQPETGRVFWQLLADGSSDKGQPLFLVLMDAGAFEPAERCVNLRLGGAEGYTTQYDIYDQLNPTSMIGSLHGQEGAVEVTVPAGAMRFLTLVVANREATLV